DRADLDGVAAEVGREGFVREGEDLDLVTAVDEVDQRVAGDLLREPGAPGALDAPLPIEVDEVADGDGLLEVALLLDEAALPGSEGEGLVLQGALATAVAHGAVEGMVDQQELEDAVLGLLDAFGRGDDFLAVGDRDEAGGLQHEPAGPLDVDQAHAAHAD